MGLFGGGTKQSSAQSTGAAASGLGEFAPKNNISLGSAFPSFDLSDPMHIAAVGFIGFCGYLAWKRFK
jgi:hypothetical protein